MNKAQRDHAAIRGAVVDSILEILERPDAPLDDTRTFAELGLTSLLGVDLIEQLSSKLGVALELRVFFEQHTIDDLVDYIATALPGLRNASPA